MKKQVLLLVFLAANGLTLHGQAVSLGVKAGVPLTDPAFGQDESRPYIIGPSVEVRLPAGFAVEASALYQRIGNSASFAPLGTILSGVNFVPLSLTSFSNQTRANSWEFPLLGKYYFQRHRAWQPFVGTGWSLRTVSVHTRGTETTTDASGVASTFSFSNNYRLGLNVGAVAAAGVRLHAGRLAILPEFRYTRWGDNNNLIRKNDVRFLLGVSF